MKNRVYKGFIPNNKNLEMVKTALLHYDTGSELNERNKDIIRSVLIDEVPTEIIAKEYGLTTNRMPQIIVGTFLKDIGYELEIKPQSRGNSKRMGVDKEEVYERYDNKCSICGFSVEGLNGGGNAIHHKIAVADGGTNEPDNLILVCPNHHMMIHRGVIVA